MCLVYYSANTRAEEIATQKFLRQKKSLKRSCGSFPMESQHTRAAGWRRDDFIIIIINLMDYKLRENLIIAEEIKFRWSRVKCDINAYLRDSSLPPNYFLSSLSSPGTFRSLHFEYFRQISPSRFVRNINYYADGAEQLFARNSTNFPPKQLNNYRLNSKKRKPKWVSNARTARRNVLHKEIQQRRTTRVSPWIILHLAHSFYHFYCFLRVFFAEQWAHIERYTINWNSDAIKLP